MLFLAHLVADLWYARELIMSPLLECIPKRFPCKVDARYISSQCHFKMPVILDRIWEWFTQPNNGPPFTPSSLDFCPLLKAVFYCMFVAWCKGDCGSMWYWSLVLDFITELIVIVAENVLMVMVDYDFFFLSDFWRRLNDDMRKTWVIPCIKIWPSSKMYVIMLMPFDLRCMGFYFGKYQFS